MSESKSTIFVGGLDDQVTSQTLHDAFLPFGDILDVSLPKPELYVFPLQIQQKQYDRYPQAISQITLPILSLNLIKANPKSSRLK
jgi:RNA recognition motif-containing protein